MVRRRRTIHPSPVKASGQDSIQRRKLSQRMGPQKIPQRKNKQRGFEKIPDGANMHDLRNQNRIHRTRIQNRASRKRNAEDRLPPRIQPEPEKTTRCAKESSSSAWVRRRSSQSTRIFGAFPDETVCANC